MSYGNGQIESVDEWEKILQFTKVQIYTTYIKDKKDSLYGLLADSWIRSVEKGLPDFVFIGGKSDLKIGRVQKNTHGKQFNIALYQLSAFNLEFEKFIKTTDPQLISSDLLSSFMRLLLDIQLSDKTEGLLSPFHKQLINNAEQFVYSKNTRSNGIDVVINNAMSEKGLMKWLMSAGAYQADLWTGAQKTANTLDKTKRITTPDDDDDDDVSGSDTEDDSLSWNSDYDGGPLRTRSPNRDREDDNDNNADETFESAEEQGEQELD